MRDEQPYQASPTHADAEPPAFEPAGRVAVLTAPEAPAADGTDGVTRTSVMDSVRHGAHAAIAEEREATENLAPVTEELADHSATAVIPETAAELTEAWTQAPQAPAEPLVSPTPATEVSDAVTAPSAVGLAPAPTAEDEAAALVASGRTGRRAATRTRRRRWPWITAAAVLLLAGVGAGGYAYASHYAHVAVPGTTVGGVSVAGMSRDQIVNLVQERASQARITITGDATATATLKDLGTTVDATASADAAMKPSHGIWSRFTALAQGNTVSVVTTSDDATLDKYALSLVPDSKEKAVNAGVTLGEDGTTFTVTPSSQGTTIDAADLKNAGAKAVATLSSQKVAVKFTTANPAVSDAQAQQVADEANALVALDVTVGSGTDAAPFTADAATKASWITITPHEGEVPTLGVDTTKVAAWVAEQTAHVDKAPVTGQRNINSAGTVVSTPVKAVNGIAVTNAEDVTTGITQALGSKTAYSGSFQTDEVEAGWNDRTIADGAEKLIYQAAPGEKWVDVNLTAKTVTAYEGATVVHGPVTVVDGKASTPTVVGTYHVYLKYAKQNMGCSAAFDYCTKDVPWVTYFTGSYALHGAPWWSSWGFSASHGCVNMPVEEAKWIYNWSEIGTTVVTHR